MKLLLKIQQDAQIDNSNSMICKRHQSVHYFIQSCKKGEYLVIIKVREISCTVCNVRYDSIANTTQST